MRPAIFVLLFCAFVFGAPLFDGPQLLRIDTNHSNIGFSVPIAGGLSEVSGKFSRFSMDLKYSSADITRSDVEVRIDAKSIDTGIDRRDQHLRTADFFHVEKYPEIVFKSRKIIRKRKKLLLQGDLTMRGVTKAISFPFTITGQRFDREKNTMIMGFHAELVLNRRDYGVDYTHRTSPGFIGDAVRIRLNIITRSNKIQR